MRNCRSYSHDEYTGYDEFFNEPGYRVPDNIDLEKLLPDVKELREVKDSFGQVFTEIVMTAHKREKALV